MTRIEREKEVVSVMIGLYCRKQHGTTDGNLCPECAELEAYAMKRLQSCKFGEEKPVCHHCPIHCYKPDMRERIRTVMRFSGPRMILYHPLMAIWYVVNSMKKPN